MEITQGVIQEFNESGKAIIIADIPNINRALFRKYKNVLIGFSDFLSLAENYSKLAKICRDLCPRMCVMKQMHANLFHFFMKQYHCDHASIRGNDFP